MSQLCFMLPLATADHDEARENSLVAMQDVFMRQLLGIYDESSIFKRLRDQGIVWTKKGARDVCDWAGIQCEGEVITEIIWPQQASEWGFRHVTLELINPHWIPPTVRVVNVSGQPSARKFLPKVLPRALLNGSFAKMGFAGRLVLTGLPQGLMMLDLSRNRFFGPIDLTALPERAKVVDLDGNRISAVFYDNVLLPDTLTAIRICGNARRVKFVALDLKDRPDERILCDRRN